VFVQTADAAKLPFVDVAVPLPKGLVHGFQELWSSMATFDYAPDELETREIFWRDRYYFFILKSLISQYGCTTVIAGPQRCTQIIPMKCICCATGRVRLLPGNLRPDKGVTTIHDITVSRDHKWENWLTLCVRNCSTYSRPSAPKNLYYNTLYTTAYTQKRHRHANK
jgi:hypothetical protein